MTSRGNSSISPPVQIPLQSQPRQVNISGLPSGTPPPQQQFYQGQTQVYDIIPSSAPQQAGQLLSYQAYGSAPNDLRGGAAGSGRGGGPQQALAQGGTIFPQPGQTMRPQQPQQPGQPAYYISQGGMRQPRPPQQPQPVVFVSQPPFQPASNVVIQPVGQYRGVPTTYYPPNQFQPFSNYQQVYYPPAQMGGRGGMMNTQNPRGPAPQPRERKVIEIKDPNSGRNVLDDYLQSQRPQSTESEQTVEDAPTSQPASDIPNLFARKVAERLKTPDTPEVPVEAPVTNGDMSGAVPVTGSQYQQPPPGPQQPGQHPPPMSHTPMMRPPMMTGQGPMHPGHMMAPHPGMMHPAASATPPEMHQRPPVDLSLPPPQLPPQVRQPGPAQMYNVGPQQGQHGQAPGPHHGPRHQQPQQVVRSAPMPPAMMAASTLPQQQAQPVVPQQQILPQQSVVVPTQSQPVVEAAPAPQVEEKRPAAVAPHQPAPSQQPAATENIPQQAAVAPVPVPAPVVEPVKENSPPPSEEVGPPSAKEPTPAREDTLPKTEDHTGANIQASKDGRKGKKAKKDLGRKDIGGSDMDAFIDEKSTDSVESVESKPPLPPSATERQNSVEKSTPVEKPAFSYAAAATSAVDSSKPSEPSAQPAPATSVSQTKPVEEKPPVPETTPAEAKPPAEVAEIKEAAPSPQPAVKKPTPEPEAPVNAPSVTHPGESPSARAPIGNGVPGDRNPDMSPAQEPVPEIKVNDENAPPKADSAKDESPAGDDGLKKPSEKGKPKVEDSKEKLQYDRKYLMELRECASSQTKPEGLPNLDIILDKPNISPSRSSMNAPLDFTPSFFQPSTGNQRHPPQIGKSSSRGRQRPDMPQQRIIKSVSIQNDAKLLHQSEKPWKPKAQGSTADADKAQNKSLEQDILFIMNRLTPTNFEKLAGEMRQLPIKTYDDLEQLVKIFFDKVTIETKFVQAYALLCRVMSQLKVPPPPDRGIKENQATFRVVMLTKCQQEFEADKSIIFEDPEEKKKKLEAEMEDTPDKVDKIDTILYKMKMKRLKFYGNIRFIGELFKLNMLTENIMHDCIFRLLKARDDDSLLSLCNLITTVGQILDTEKAKARMDQYFTQMEKIAEERKSRIKFTLKDAIDLRSNNWVPRKETAAPKKIDEIHKDFAQEQARNQFLNSQPPPPRNETPQPGSRRGSRQREEQKPSDDGWNTVGSKSLRIDASKMKLSKNVVDEDNIQLGPGGGMNKFSLWGRGSLGSSQPSQDSERPAPAGNRFSALRNDEDRRNFQRSPSRGDSGPASRGIRQTPTAGHGRGKILARSSQEGERRDLLNSARSIVGGGRSQNSSRDNSWNREDRRPAMGPRGSREGESQMTRSDIVRHTEEFRTPNVPAAPAKKIKEMSEEEMEAKAKTILEEYLNIKDLAEAKLCVSELAGQSRLHLVVSASINDVLERNNQARELTGQYLHELVKNNVLSLETYSKGLSEVLQFAEDMVIDIPMMWTYLAQLTAPLLVGGSLPWKKLSTTLKPDLSDSCAVLFLVQLVKVATALTSEAEVAQMWQNSGLSWADFVSPSEVEKFLKEKQLEYTIKPVSADSLPSRTPSSSEADFQKLSQDIEAMSAQGRPNTDLNAHIEKSVPSEKRDKAFVRALTTAIIKSSIARPDPKLNEEMIKRRREILQTYINKPEFELEALFAIQALMVELEHPKAVINSLFDSFYNEEIVSEEAFKLWETSPAEQSGKGACLLQLKQFFTWLRENEEVEASS